MESEKWVRYWIIERAGTTAAAAAAAAASGHTFLRLPQKHKSSSTYK
jgi:hypothetical protein